MGRITRGLGSDPGFRTHPTAFPSA